jgi:hypothetical protein
MEQDRVSFSTYLDKRISRDELGFFSHPVIQRAYYTGGYAKAVILSSFKSEVSKNNQTFKNWLSNQVINARNLDRIFEVAFRFEQKLKLRLRNGSEVRALAHSTPMGKAQGLSSAKVSFAFVAGFDDYGRYLAENKILEKDAGKENA